MAPGAAWVGGACRARDTTEKPMTKGRLEAFSDGVIAIVITIMVLELQAPHGRDWAALSPVLPRALTYLLSFLYLGIYWNNHHHLLLATQRISGSVLWANLHLLFWLSLIPFATAWLGESRLAPAAAALYGAILFLAAVAYTILLGSILTNEGPDSILARAVGRDRKGKVSLGLYAVAIPLAFVSPWASVAFYIIVALIWLVPDRRIETVLGR
jgi:uncharacterized membrane protein